MLLYDLLLAPLNSTPIVGQQQHGSNSVQMSWRAAALALTAAAYIGTRQAISGGKQLVSIYRKVHRTVLRKLRSKN